MALVEGRRLSLIRVGVVLLAIAVVAFASLQGWRWFQDARVKVSGQPWFAGYVDVTATPSYAFEEPVTEAGTNAVLSFIVADPDDPCEPSWGGFHTPDEAEAELDLDRRIARLRQLGGTPVISFGGQANTELAVSCTDAPDLYRAYWSVVDRYESDVIDLDIEGQAMADHESAERRAEALSRLQESEGTEVWVTLPVAPHGLPEDAVKQIRILLDGGVDLAGVNLMTMDYGESKPADASMAEASIDALEATHAQLDTLYRDRDDRRTSAQLWRLMGATPMLGQNDVAGEVFSLEDATRLAAFAQEMELGRLSLWSLNRDRTCSSNWPDVTQVSDSCSGVNQEKGAFAMTLGDGFDGAPELARSSPSTSSPTAASRTVGAAGTDEASDDPDASPYQVWNAEQAYQNDERVVWKRNVYVAKWWTAGDLPNDPTVADDASPWRLVGPVLPGESPEPVPTLPAGTFPKWRPAAVYVAGDRVQLGGAGYEATWWNQGVSPDAPSTRDTPSPWVRLDATDLTR